MTLPTYTPPTSEIHESLRTGESRENSNLCVHSQSTNSLLWWKSDSYPSDFRLFFEYRSPSYCRTLFWILLLQQCDWFLLWHTLDEVFGFNKIAKREKRVIQPWNLISESNLSQQLSLDWVSGLIKFVFWFITHSSQDFVNDSHRSR